MGSIYSVDTLDKGMIQGPGQDGEGPGQDGEEQWEIASCYAEQHTI